MEKFKNAKEEKFASSGKTFLMIGGVFLIINSLLTIVSGVTNLATAIQASNGEKEIVEWLMSEGIEIGFLKISGIMYTLMGISEICCGFMIAKLSNRLQKMGLIFKISLGLMVIEIASSVVLFTIDKSLNTLAQSFFSGILIPFFFMQLTRRLRKLAENYPENEFLVPPYPNYTKKAKDAKGKSVMERATGVSKKNK